MTTLALIDLASLFVPAWKAVPPTEPADAPHNITVARVRSIAAEHDHCAIALDSPTSERKKLYPDYKANRSLAPDEVADREAMIVQLRRVAETLRADGFAVWESEGLEADDVIATAVEQVDELKQVDLGQFRVTIYSADKDLRQLIDPNGCVVCQSTRLSADGNRLPVEDFASVIRRYGVSPAELTDWLAIVGDTSDNVPGIPKVGPKGATMLLERFGSLESALMAAGETTPCACVQALEPGEKPGCKSCTNGARYKHEMKPAGRAALLQYAEQARLSRELVRLRTTAKIDISEALQPRVAKPLPRRESEPVPDEDPMTDDADFEPIPKSEEKPAAPPADAPKTEETKATPPATVAETVTAIVRAPDPGTDQWAMTLEPNGMRQATWLAQACYDSRVYGNFPTWEAALCAIIQGRELGLPAIASLRLTHVIEGKLAMHAMMIIGLVHKSGLATYFKCTERTAERATWKGHRKGDPDPEPTVVTYTIGDAKRANLIRGGSNWEKRPTEMLTKTAGVQLARLLWPDVVGGLYFPEELGHDAPADDEAA